MKPLNLEPIRQMAANLRADSQSPWLRAPILDALDNLLAEVERLRAENDQLRSEVSALKTLAKLCRKRQRTTGLGQ